jgi:hypothetical protein
MGMAWLVVSLLAAACRTQAQDAHGAGAGAAVTGAATTAQTLVASLETLERRFHAAQSEAVTAEAELERLRQENAQLRSGRVPLGAGLGGAGGGGGGTSGKKVATFVVVLVLVLVVLGGIGHAKQNQLGPFAPGRNLKKSDGELGGDWHSGGGGSFGGSGGGGGGGGGGGYDPSADYYGTGAQDGGTYNQFSQPASSFTAPPPPSAAEARAALSRRGR